MTENDQSNPNPSDDGKKRELPQVPPTERERLNEGVEKPNAQPPKVPKND